MQQKRTNKIIKQQIKSEYFMNQVGRVIKFRVCAPIFAAKHIIAHSINTNLIMS